MACFALSTTAPVACPPQILLPAFSEYGRILQMQPLFRRRTAVSTNDAGSRGSASDGETVIRTPEVVFRTCPHVTRRAGDVNSPVTVRARVARTASGTHQGRYRPIDIDRSPWDVFCDSFGLGTDDSWGIEMSQFSCPHTVSPSQGEAPAEPHPCHEHCADRRCFAKTPGMAHSADQSSTARQLPRPPVAPTVFLQDSGAPHRYSAEARAETANAPIFHSLSPPVLPFPVAFG